MKTLPCLCHPGLLAALVLLAGPQLRAEAAKPAPPADREKLVEVLFHAPTVEQSNLSPDGKRLCFICEVNDRKVAGVYDLQKRTQRLAGLDFLEDVRWVRWTGPEQLLLGLNGIYTADLDLRNVRELPLPDRRVSWQFEAWRPQDPDHLLLLSHPHSSLYPELHALTLSTKRVKLVESNPGTVAGWALDEAGVARLAITPERNFTASFQSRENADAAWKPEPLPASASPLFFTPDGQSLLITHRTAPGRAVVQDYDLRQHRLAGEPILSDPFCDIDPVLLRDNQTGAPIGLRYQTEKPQTLWFNPAYGKLHALIQRNFPGQVVSILGPMPDKRVLFLAYSDAVPPAFYVLDLAHAGISLLLETLPAAAPYAWAPMQPVTFPARDGYDLHGYLTLPLHRPAGRPVPLVALSHGGPRARDQWGFSPEAQYLAALGYAVLQVNYRGSTGYGVNHELKNTLQVCEKSVDDVVDGINWAVQSGYANPKKIAVYGASYGGYISLAIATRYPGLPAACVGFAGVYDWENQYDYDDSASHEKMQFLLGTQDYYIDPASAGTQFRAFSPARSADKVLCPVLLLHGGADQVVDIAQTNLMAKALRNAGKSVEVVKDAQVIHGLPNEAERRTFYRKLGEFLLKNVPPDPAP